jgi:hypothetical protein
MERETEQQTTGGRRGTAASRADASRSEIAAPRGDVSMADDAGFAAQDQEEAVRRRAYEIYESRGGSPGRELDDWYAAEEEIRRTRGGQQS